MLSIKKLEDEITVNGKTVPVIIHITTEVDTDFSIDWEIPEEDKNSIQRQLDNHTMTPIGVTVKANALGLEHVDSLWGNLIQTAKFNDEVLEIVKDNHMINEVKLGLGEAIKSVLDFFK